MNAFFRLLVRNQSGIFGFAAIFVLFATGTFLGNERRPTFQEITFSLRPADDREPFDETRESSRVSFAIDGSNESSAKGHTISDFLETETSRSSRYFAALPATSSYFEYYAPKAAEYAAVSSDYEVAASEPSALAPEASEPVATSTSFYCKTETPTTKWTIDWRFLRYGFFIVLPAALFILAYYKPISTTACLRRPDFFYRGQNNNSLVLFIHGWNGDKVETWKKFPSLLHDDPRFKGVDIIVIQYPTFMLNGNLHIAQLADWLQEKLEDDFQKYSKIVVIAHSMGGLLARQMAILQHLGESGHRFGLLIEIGTPHQGASPALLASALGISKSLTRDMAHESSSLSTLQKQWERMRLRPATYYLTSPQDSVVPSDSAMYQCDNGVMYPQWNHTELVKPESEDDDRYSLPTKRLVEYLEA